MNTFRLGLLLATFAVSATTHATPVSVSISFDRFTMGGFYGPDHAFFTGLEVDGSAVEVCGGDPTCAAAIANPASVTTVLGGGSSVEFGYDSTLAPSRKNVLSFTGNTADVAATGPDNQFMLGTLFFTNGAFHPLAFIDFTLTTQSTDSALDGKTFMGRFRLDTNSFDEIDPEAEADFFTVQDAEGVTLDPLGSVRVYDYSLCPPGFPGSPACNTGSVDLIGHIASLHLDDFTNPTGGAFVNVSTGPELDQDNSVPVPATWLLTGLGLFALRFARRS